MVILPLSPVLCALISVTALFVTFHIGRFCGIKLIMNRIEQEMRQSDDKL